MVSPKAKGRVHEDARAPRRRGQLREGNGAAAEEHERVRVERAREDGAGQLVQLRRQQRRPHARRRDGAAATENLLLV